VLLCLAYYYAFGGQRQRARFAAIVVLYALAPVPVLVALSARRFARSFARHRAFWLAWCVSGSLLCTALTLEVFGADVSGGWWLAWVAVVAHVPLGLCGACLVWSPQGDCFLSGQRTGFRNPGLERDWKCYRRATYARLFYGL